MRKHLLKLHLAEGESHKNLAKCDMEKAELFRTAAQMCHKARGSSMDEGLHDCFKSLAAEYESSSEAHATAAKAHVDLGKSLGEISTHDDSRGVDVLRAAAGSERFGMLAARDVADLDKLVPTRVHGVMPQDIPPAPGRLISRFGGPPAEGQEDPADALDKFAHSSDEIQKAILR